MVKVIFVFLLFS